MITNKDFVSRVANSIKAITKDGRISRRYILNIGRTKSKFLIAQKLGELSLSRETSLIKDIPCVPFIPINIKECPIIEFKLCTNIMRSKSKVEGLINSKSGSGVVSVVSLDDGIEYREITPSQYRRNKQRKYSKKYFYYVKDGYIYLPDSTNEMLDIEIINVEMEKNKKLSSCSEETCTSVWDQDFVLPDRLLDLVIKDTIQEVASIYRSSIEDENPNLDSNIKSQSTQ